MSKERIAALWIMVCCTIVCFILLGKPTKSYPTKYEKVRIDSISSKTKYGVCIENVWTYHTKLGTFTRTKKCFQVGDSIMTQTIDVRTK